MKRYKKIICFLLAAMMLLSVTGCKKKPKYPERDLVDLPTELPKATEDSIAIHYSRKDNIYDKWALWLWDPAGDDDNAEDYWNYQDDYGVIAFYPLSKFGALSEGKLGIIVKSKGSWSAKDGTDSDRFIIFSTLEKDENNTYHVYLSSGDAHIYDNPDLVISDMIITANFSNDKTIYIKASNPLDSFRVYENKELIFEGDGLGRSTISQALEKSAQYGRNYTVEVTFRGSGTVLSSDVDTSAILSGDSFDDLYYYDGELGAIYSASSTVFKVWSPVSSMIKLRIYENGTPTSVNAAKGSDKYDEYKMTKGEKGVFSYILSGNNEGKYYTYVVYNDSYPDGKEIVDPYAKSTGINGLRGMIVDFSKTNPKGWDNIDYLNIDRKAMTVWETHVADVTSSETWTGKEENRRKYLGLIEEGTTFASEALTVTTGFDHIKELGINAIQLQPIFDQANDETSYTFNWGYNPLNYNTLEGMYSSDPYDGYARIKEFKQVVMAFNQAGISVIMDVVYNHVNGAKGSNFDVLMPGYYFRYNTDGSLSNGSGCGNETASENSMMRKFIIDSITFWTKEYKLGGFRFDLMGLHDIETMNEATKAAQAINKNIVIYGEPWTGGTSTLNKDVQAKQENGNQFVGYGQFNDQMRDGLIKGGLNGPEAKGWVTDNEHIVQSDVTSIVKGINGITYNIAYSIEDANKTTNYVTCHDNYTLYDRIKAAGITGEDTIRKMAMLANSVVFTSSGTSFMLAGEEFLRTKQGNSNSYMAGDDINALDYSLKVKNYDIFENYRSLIYFKQNTEGLQTNDKNIQVETLENGALLKYKVMCQGKEYVIIHGNGLCKNVPVDLSGYNVFLDTQGCYYGMVGSVTIFPYQTLILEK